MATQELEQIRNKRITIFLGGCEDASLRLTKQVISLFLREKVTTNLELTIELNEDNSISVTSSTFTSLKGFNLYDYTLDQEKKFFKNVNTDYLLTFLCSSSMYLSLTFKEEDKVYKKESIEGLEKVTEIANNALSIDGTQVHWKMYDDFNTSSSLDVKKLDNFLECMSIAYNVSFNLNDKKTGSFKRYENKTMVNYLSSKLSNALILANEPNFIDSEDQMDSEDQVDPDVELVLVITDQAEGLRLVIHENNELLTSGDHFTAIDCALLDFFRFEDCNLEYKEKLKTIQKFINIGLVTRSKATYYTNSLRDGIIDAHLRTRIYNEMILLLKRLKEENTLAYVGLTQNLRGN